MVSGWQYTWRNAMVHWGEATSGWRVRGIHLVQNKTNSPVEMASEEVTDCSIYNGWWDRNNNDIGEDN